MNRTRSRLAVVGALALALCLAMGLVSGSAADAKKKKSKRSFTVSTTTPAVVPGAPGPGETVMKIPIGTVGKKIGKGKVVSLNGVSVTTTFSGSPGFADGVTAVLQGPSGRQGGLINPVPNLSGPNNNETSSGPLTETPNSATGVCVPDNSPPPPPCSDPDNTVGPPYIGTIGNEALLNFSGSAVVGTFFLKVFNANAEPITVNAVAVTGGLITKPT
jgi:hypothetical protein